MSNNNIYANGEVANPEIDYGRTLVSKVKNNVIKLEIPKSMDINNQFVHAPECRSRTFDKEGPIEYTIIGGNDEFLNIMCNECKTVSNVPLHTINEKVYYMLMDYVSY